ncbi:glycoside hydrolase family 3 C-terminal domain-containing protein, partial [Acinetobacter baumannii]|nr:glycoside hydrolase family 3 C-terminal domain-containing protein [Acinetobacter baumannii]
MYEPEKAKEAIELARLSDVAVVFAGLPESMESEGFDRQHINLPDCQNRLIEEICAVQKNVVVVL